jgi:hypothetical protein
LLDRLNLDVQEGWQPATFKSSRSERADRKKQAVEDFLDDDELTERQKGALRVTVGPQRRRPL